MDNRLNEIQFCNETDVLGTMLADGSMVRAMLIDLHAEDFRFKQHIELYQEMKQIQRLGKFKTQDLVDKSETISRLLSHSLPTNFDVKCQWLLEQSLKRFA